MRCADSLRADWLTAALVAVEGPWTGVEVVARTGSTNADLLARARDGAPEGLILAAREQTAGRGRQGRTWRGRPGAALTFSVLLRPHLVPQPARGWLPLLAGVATATAVRTVTAVEASLKWPNDVLVGEGKLAGILAEQSGDAIVIGIGLNVLGQPGDLPVPTATSLEQHQAGEVDPNDLVAEILGQFANWYQPWSRFWRGDPDQSGLRPAYVALCGTLGRTVAVELPGGKSLRGEAANVDRMGRLGARWGRGGGRPPPAPPVPISAGDVIHVR
jgi:BirA family biotin operon repressor/biotin-[acetyl-CoA-carboxylase] ligase